MELGSPLLPLIYAPASSVPDSQDVLYCSTGDLERRPAAQVETSEPLAGSYEYYKTLRINAGSLKRWLRNRRVPTTSAYCLCDEKMREVASVQLRQQHHCRPLHLEPDSRFGL